MTTTTKYTLSLLLALVLLCAAHGQRGNRYSQSDGRIHGLITAGAALSQVEGDELKGFQQLGVSAGIGALADLNHSRSLQLGVELLFVQRGSWQKVPDPYAMNLYLNYLDIPVMLHFTDPIGGIKLGAGLYYGRLLRQPHSTIVYNPNYVIPDTTNLAFLKNDIGVVADVRFAVWRGLYLDLRWQHSIIPIKRDWTFFEWKGSYLYRRSHNAYNHSIALRLIWQF